MEDRRIYIKEITDDVLDNYFSSLDNLSSLLNSDSKRGSRILANKIKRIFQEFEEYCPLTASVIVQPDNNGYYEFHDNYKDLLDGKISVDQLELIPLTVAKVSGGNTLFAGRLAATSNYWKYSAPVLRTYSTNAKVLVDAIFHYPLVFSFTDDGYLNAASHIYGLDFKQRSMLFNLCELRILEMIRSNENRIDLPTTVKFFNLDEDITVLREKVEQDKVSCSALGIAWR